MKYKVVILLFLVNRGASNTAKSSKGYLIGDKKRKRRDKGRRGPLLDENPEPRRKKEPRQQESSENWSKKEITSRRNGIASKEVNT